MLDIMFEWILSLGVISVDHVMLLRVTVICVTRHYASHALFHIFWDQMERVVSVSLAMSTIMAFAQISLDVKVSWSTKSDNKFALHVSPAFIFPWTQNRKNASVQRGTS